MIKKSLINKPRGLYGKLLLRLKEVERGKASISKNGFIAHTDVYEKLCRNFAIRKHEVTEIMLVLRDLSLIEISPKGIRLSYEVKNG